MIKTLYAGNPASWEKYRDALEQRFDKCGIRVDLAIDHASDDVDYIIYAPNGHITDFTPFTKCKAVLSLWAGVEKIIGNTTLTQPLTRMVDSGLERGMVEWVCGHVLRYHLGMDAHIVNPDHQWQSDAPPLAIDRKICVLGIGTLGAACAAKLSTLGFDVYGWSRRTKQVDGITCHHGANGLRRAITGADMIVLLLPQTPETENILNAETLALMKRGGFVINPGRGPLIDDQALLNALNNGQIAHATLDTFRIEPLPKDHPFWSHPNVTVTPHIASETRANSAAEVICENIKRSEAGEPLLFLVDRSLGY